MEGVMAPQLHCRFLVFDWVLTDAAKLVFDAVRVAALLQSVHVAFHVFSLARKHPTTSACVWKSVCVCVCLKTFFKVEVKLNFF
jgi:hypothetical protein